jgi:hypothetical protein
MTAPRPPNAALDGCFTRAMVRICAVTGIAAIALTVSSLRPADRNIPPKEELWTASGRIVSHELRRRSRGRVVRFKMEGQKDRLFVYANRDDPVGREALCVGCEVTVWLPQPPSAGRTVLQIATHRKIVTSYEEIRARTIRERRTHPRLAKIFAVTSLVSGLFCFLAWRSRKREQAMPPGDP